MLFVKRNELMRCSTRINTKQKLMKAWNCFANILKIRCAQQIDDNSVGRI